MISTAGAGRGEYLLGPPLIEGKATYHARRARDDNADGGLIAKAFPGASGSTQRRAEREWDIANRFGDGVRLPRTIDRVADGETLWLVFDALPGRSVRDLIEETGAQDAHAVRRIGAGVADALGILHTEGLAHADLSPSNCIVRDDGSAGLCDLGEVTDGSNADETLAFTPGYAAPERMQGRTSLASDIYSLGAVLYEAWTGIRPESPTRREWPLGCDDMALRRLISECLHPVPGFRPTVAEVAQRLRQRTRAVDWRPAAFAAGLLSAAVLLLAVGPLSADGGFVLDHDRDWTAVVRAAGPVEYYLTVPAKDPWFTTGLRLEPGDTVLIEASGEAAFSASTADRTGPEGKTGHYDPEAIMPSVPSGALIGRIGIDGEPFLVGPELRFTADEAGVLYLSMNDRIGMAGFHDNEGRWPVQIRRPAP